MAPTPASSVLRLLKELVVARAMVGLQLLPRMCKALEFHPQDYK